MNNNCPKCGKKMSPFYLKQNCPDCGVDLLYYKLDERLEADALQAEKEVNAVNKFLNIIKSSTIAKPILIVRLVLFFTPLASMCLPMYSDESLISIIMGLIGEDLAINDVLMPIIAMGLVVVLSLAVIISSLFSSTKTGLVRNMIFSIINTAVFVAMSIIIGSVGIGFYVTLVIYILEIILHIVCNSAIRKN